MRALTTIERSAYHRSKIDGGRLVMSDDGNHGERSIVRPNIWKRTCHAIDNHPIPALILTVAVITAVMWRYVDSSVVILNQAASALHSEVARIDGVVKDVGAVTADIRQIRDNVSKIDNKIDVFGPSLKNVESSTASLTSQFNSIKPFQVRVIESFGVPVDEQLIVEVVHGKVLAFPAVTRLMRYRRLNFAGRRLL